MYAFTFPQVETTTSNRAKPHTVPASAATSVVDKALTLTADVDFPAADEGTFDEGTSKERVNSGIHGHNSTTEDVRAAFQVLQASVMENAQVYGREALGVSSSPMPLTTHTRCIVVTNKLLLFLFIFARILDYACT